jgi:hypothetical protein
MSQTENHWSEVKLIEAEIARYMIALGLDWHDDAAMTQLASECKIFGPENAKAAFASKDQHRISKAQLFGLVSTMIQTMKSAALDERDVHGGDIWKAFAKHLYV